MTGKFKYKSFHDGLTELKFTGWVDGELPRKRTMIFHREKLFQCEGLIRVIVPIIIIGVI